MTPKEFEHRIARIVSVIEGSGARVTWNDHVIDPDNPKQLRQVDITIRRADSLSIVECRLHSRPQDVQWVEELYGRRASLHATLVMGVSASGFTEGAWKKGAALGVYLRDLRELTDNEITSWGRRTNVRLAYVCFRRVTLHLVPTSAITVPLRSMATVLRMTDGQQWPIDELFRNAANQLSRPRVPEGIVRLQFFEKDLFVGGFPVPELILDVDWRWVHREVTLPTVFAFRGADRTLANADAVIESNRYSRTEVSHTVDGVFVVIDVSLAPLEPAAYLRSISLDLGQPLPMRGFGLIGLGEEQRSVMRLRVRVCRRDSLEYRMLVSDHRTSLVL